MRTVADLSAKDFPDLPADKIAAWRDAYVAAENARKPAMAAFLPAAGVVGAIGFFAPALTGLAVLLACVSLIVLFGYALVGITPNHRRAQALQKELGLTRSEIASAIRGD